MKTLIVLFSLLAANISHAGPTYKIIFTDVATEPTRESALYHAEQYAWKGAWGYALGWCNAQQMTWNKMTDSKPSKINSKKITKNTSNAFTAEVSVTFYFTCSYL